MKTASMKTGRTGMFLAAGLVIGLLLTLPACWGNSETETVTFTIRVRGHMTNAVIKTVTITGTLDRRDGLTVTWTNLAGGTSGYATGFFVVREPGFGPVLGFSLGETSKVMESTEATTLDAYLLQENDDAVYAQVLKDVSYGLVVPRNSLGERVDRDGQTGPDSVWITALNKINNKLGYTGSTGLGGNHFGCGYGDCNGGDGYHDIPGLWIGVNNEKGMPELGLIRTAVNETGEFLTRSDNKVDFNSEPGTYASRAFMVFAE